MRRRFPRDEITMAQARAQLSLLLSGATDVALAAMTPELLARTHRLPVREIECRLLAAQDRRRRAASA